MSDHDFVSVVLPTFNRAHVIQRAIGSVLSQTYDNLELIVIDDGSSDGTGEVVQSLSDPRIKYIKLDRNRGQSHARNVGIREARGNFVAFQDSDDVWIPDKLSKQLHRINGQMSTAGVYCDLLRIPLSGEPFLIATREPTIGKLLDPTGAIYQTYGIGIQSCLLRRSALRAVGGFREWMRCFEDLELLLRIVQRWRLNHLEEALVHYFETDGASVIKDYRAEIRARVELMLRYGINIALSNPKFLYRELRKIKRLAAQPA